MSRQAVKVRVDFGVDGKLLPLKFKYRNECGETITIDVKRILDRYINNFAGNRMYIFKCESVEGIENAAMQSFELRYELDTCLWYFYY